MGLALWLQKKEIFYQNSIKDKFSYLNSAVYNNRPNQYTLGVSKYLSKNYGAKIQASLSWTDGSLSISDYRGSEYEVDLLPKTKIEIAVSDEKADEGVEAISTSANSNKIGDGKIFVVDLNQLVRIRTGDLNEDAL